MNLEKIALGRLHKNEHETPMRGYVEAGDVIGFKKNGDPIYLIGGGARNTYEAWIPEEWGGAVITRVNRVSAVERLARREPMGTDTKHVPRSAGVGVASIAKGGAYGEDVSANDDVLLTAIKVGRAIRIADEDLQDTSRLADIIAVKQNDWATSYGKFMDNATLAVSAASNGTTIPYNSVYYALSQTNAATSYTANDNITKTGVSGTTYTTLSTALGDYEDGDYFDEERTIVIASPVYRRKLRNVMDTQGQPIFVRGQGGDRGTPDTLFGHPVVWSLGARLSATATDSPTSNPIMVIANRDYLILGVRSGPETRTAGADTGAAFLTDEALLKMRARRGFVVGHEKAMAVHEDNSGS